MSYKNKDASHNLPCEFLRLSVMLLLLMPTIVINAQPAPPKKSPNKASRYSYLPTGYNQVGSTQLYSKQYSEAIDMIGFYNGYYYSSTYNDYGYKLSVQVGNNSAVRVDCLNGTTNNSVAVQPSVEQQGELARICYTVTNTNANDVTISMGVHADVMIGYNDSAPISRRIDTFGQTYGLTMMDGNGAQLCVLFGSGLAGVTAVSDFWFGSYYTNYEPYQMVGNYYTGDCWMIENGAYDSGMGWCWKDRTIAAGSTVVFSYLIGVGEVNLEPNSSFEVTPDDPDGWNDLSRPHRLTLDGIYESPAGLDGVIDYAVEDSEEWTALTDTLASGDGFTASLVAMFDATKATHVIKFRTRDLVGNTTMLQPIEYADVSSHALTGIQEKTYTGDSLFQSNLICDLPEDRYVLTSYRNNINAGTASFNMEGVFPYTIGRKSYTFDILPQPLSGDIVLAETEFVYNGEAFTTDWQFSNANYSGLKADEDYIALWNNNTQPGTGTLTVTGMNNYTSTLRANIHIDKAPLAENLYSLTFPAEDLVYDEQPHGVTVNVLNGVGNATIFYLNEETGIEQSQAPTLPGTYKVYLTIDEGTLYYGMSKTEIGSLTILMYNTEQYALLSQMATDTRNYHMYYGTRAKLTQFLQSSSAALESGDVTTIYQAFMPMESLLAEAQASVEKYNLLAGYITYAQQVQDAYGSMLTDEINAKISETIAKLQLAYSFGAMTNEEIDQVWPQLQETMRTELTNYLKPYIDDANALIAQGLVEDIHNRLSQTIQDVQTMLTWSEYSVDDADYIKNLLFNLRNFEVEAQANVQDLAILRQAYQSMGGAEKMAGYWQFETAPYRLNGVTFTAGQIMGITLENRNLTGNIPTALFMLPQLNTLNLSRNQLIGDISQVCEQLTTSDQTSPIVSLNISNNQLSGNIGVFANCFENLSSLNASYNCFEDVFPMIPLTVTSLDLKGQTISRIVDWHFGNVSTEFIAQQIPHILLYDHANQTFTTDISLLCTTSDNSWSMMIDYRNGQLTYPSVSEQNAYYGESGDVLDAVKYNNGTREGSTFRISLCFDEGDGNFDGKVDVLDLQTTLNYMFEEYTNKPYNFTASNLWKDDIINVQDAVSLVNLLLDADMDSANMAHHAKRAPAFTESDASVFIKDGQLIINTTIPVSAFDIVISTKEKCEVLPALSDMGYTCTLKRDGNQVHLIGYSLSGATLSTGDNVICNVSEGSLDYVMLADKEAQEIKCHVGGSATNIQNTKDNAQSPIVYRISVGARRAIGIDSAGKKTMIKDE